MFGLVEETAEKLRVWETFSSLIKQMWSTNLKSKLNNMDQVIIFTKLKEFDLKFSKLGSKD